METFRVQNGDTGAFWEDEAESAKGACDKAGWDWRRCWVRQRSDKGNWVLPLEDIELGRDNRAFHGMVITESEAEVITGDGTGDVLPAVSVSTGDVVMVDHEPTADSNVVESEFIEMIDVALQEIIPVTSEVIRPDETAPEPYKAAFVHRLEIMQLAQGAQSMFLQMGGLLYNCAQNKEWLQFGDQYQSFKDYVADLGLPVTSSYSWATRLMGIWEHLVVNMKIPETLLMQIGVAKLTRLLPAARDGTLTEELLEKAKALSDLDLRASLGHNVGGSGEVSIIRCPGCGCEIKNAKPSGGEPWV